MKFFKKKKKKPVLKRDVDEQGRVSIGGVLLDDLLGAKPLSKAPGPGRSTLAIQKIFRSIAALVTGIVKLPFRILNQIFKAIAAVIKAPFKLIAKIFTRNR